MSKEQEPISFMVTNHVTKDDTAYEIGSGDVEVLATPVMMCWMEMAAKVAATAVTREGEITVGGYIEALHLAPTKVGDVVDAEAVLVKQTGKRLSFNIEARCGDTIIGKGTHVRYIVNKDEFMKRLD